MNFTRLDLLTYLLPLTVLILALSWKMKRNYITHPLVHYLREKIPSVSPWAYLPRFLEILALGCLLLALLNPVRPLFEHFVAHQGLQIVLLLDLSSSMEEYVEQPGQERPAITRTRITRLDVVKEALKRFVQRRRGDRIGLVVFSENGYVVAPMTADIDYLRRYIQLVDHKTLESEGQTAIGEGILTALHLARKQTHSSKNKGKAFIVLTDGENNTGRDVYQAIREASSSGFKIHFIGIHVDRAEDAPRLIATVQATGGKYYDVRDPYQLEKAYSDIDRLEKGTFVTKERVIHMPYFYPFALTSLLLLATSIAIRAIPYFTEIS